MCPAQLLLSRVSLEGAGTGLAVFLCMEVESMLVKEEKGTLEISLE